MRKNLPPSDLPIASLWRDQLVRASNSHNPLKTQAPEIFFSRLGQIGPEILAGTSGLRMTQDESDAVLTLLEQGLPLCQQLIMQNAFREGLSAGNRDKRWEIYLPPLRQLTRHFANLVKPQHFALLTNFDRVQNAVLERLANILDAEFGVLCGALLFSAAAYDGVAITKALNAIAAIEASQISIRRGICVVNLGEAGIWLPHALSQALLFALLRRFSDQPANRVEHPGQPSHAHKRATSTKEALKSLGEFLNLGAEDRRLLRDRLSALTRAFHGTYLPGYLLGYAHEINKSTSLSSSGYARMLGGSAPDAQYVNLSQARNERQTASIPERRDHRSQVMQQIRRMLENLECHPALATPEQTIEKLRDLRDNASDLWPIQRLLADWIEHEIPEVQRKGGAWSSLIKYYQSIWWPLMISLTNIDPLKLDEVSIEDCLDEALNQAPSIASQMDLQQGLRIFLAYLTKARGLFQVNYQNLENWLTSAQRPVNADWLTPQEFDAVINIIQSGAYAKQPWLIEICVHVACLCYRGGLRRREPTVARVMDLQRSKTPELIVRETLFGSLKSAQAERRIPINGLLPPEEALALLEYCQRRLEASGPQAPLFVDPEHPNQPLDPDTIFRPITKAMIQATGRDVVAHLLRHSATNTALLQFEAADGSIEFPKETWVFSHPNFSIERCKAVKNAVFRRFDSDPPDSGERNLYALALLVGHLSPSTTLKSYVHTLDLLMHLHGQSIQPVVRDHRILASALGVKTSRLYQIAGENSIPAHDLTLERLLYHIQRRTEHILKPGQKSVE